jgi:hypothetical protein
MGEILRATSVTGTRKLDAARVEPRPQEAEERATAVKGSPRRPTRDPAEAMPREEKPAFNVSAPAPSSVADPAQTMGAGVGVRSKGGSKAMHSLKLEN